MRRLIPALCTLIVLTARPACAQNSAPATPGDASLVNLDTAAVNGRGRIGVRIDVRAFNKPEDLVYTSAGLTFGISPSSELGVRGTFAPTKSFAVANGSGFIDHGKTDIELFYKRRLSDDQPTAFLIGASFPNTPAQSQDAVPTVGFTATLAHNDRTSIVFNPRAALVKGNGIVGLGVGGSMSLFSKLSLVGDFTGIVNGRNTLSTVDGGMVRRDVYGVALRYAADMMGMAMAIDVGWTNGSGITTGQSLTPGLGNSGAVFAAVHIRR